MIRILNNVFDTNGWGNHAVALAAGVHEENEATLRQVALGNAVHTDEPATMDGAGPIVAAEPAAPEPAPSVEAAPAAAVEAAAPAEAPAAEAAAPAPAAGKGKKA